MNNVCILCWIGQQSMIMAYHCNIIPIDIDVSHHIEKKTTTTSTLLKMEFQQMNEKAYQNVKFIKTAVQTIIHRKFSISNSI